MKNLIRKALAVCIGVGLVGCEWQGGGDGSSWNSRYNFVNFSGTYKGAGTYLISAYSESAGSSSGGGTTDTGDSYVNRQETTTRNVQLNSVISGKITYAPVLPGSFSITGSGALGGMAVRDDGDGGLEGSAFNIPGFGNVTITGYIVYSTGAWGLTLGAAAQYDTSTTLTIDYSQVVSGGSVPTSPTSSAPGTSKVKIYVFNVFQEGNKLRIVDNNGSVYEGSFGSIRTTGGVDQDTTFPTYSNGDQMTAQFEAKGRSAANIAVQMVGNFSATISGVTSSGDGSTVSMRLTDRRIMGTWIESGGVTGDINGLSSPVSVSTTTETTTTE